MSEELNILYRGIREAYDEIDRVLEMIEPDGEEKDDSPSMILREIRTDLGLTLSEARENASARA